MHHSFKHYWQLYLLALPAVVLMLTYRYLPMFGLSLGFTNYRVGMSFDRVSWVGLKWFQQMFSNKTFLNVLWNTVYISMLKLLFSFPAPILLALLLNEMDNQWMKKRFQTMIYLPHFLSWTIVAGILFTLFSTQTGIVKYFGMKESIFLNPSAFRWMLVFSDIWKDAGWGTIIYLAAISSISPEYYEAAMIDGATRSQRMRYITLPCISSTVVVLLLLKLGNVLDAGFDQVFMLSNAAVLDSADIIDTYVYRIGMSQGKFAVGTAAGLFKSVVGCSLVFLANRAVKLADPEAGIM
ncbi:MAG: ABC transporter permease subunit [Eubacteriales bacterium]|nr:ABC transporter permease subunit [Eubacteriales bacterium]